jgi:hypothetical protein
MTYQYGYGRQYVIPIYSWYLEGGDRKVLVDTGEMRPIASSDREERIGGRAAITGFCVIMENFFPPREITSMEMEVIPPGTHVNAYRAYDIMVKVRDEADILIPLHEPRFASVDTIP